MALPLLLLLPAVAAYPSAYSSACMLEWPASFQPLCRLLRPGGIYSFFNGLAPDNLFFHLVYGKIAELELARWGELTSLGAGWLLAGCTWPAQWA